MATPLAIKGTGIYSPKRRVASTEIDIRIGRPEGWTEANFGIRERGVASSGETASTMAAAAAEAALGAACWAPEDLEVIVAGSGVMEQAVPGTAPLVQAKLGLGASGIPAFDVNATCLSFMLALDTVAMGMAAGRWRRALIVSADIASAGLDFDDPEASVIFGDGAAAVVLQAGGDDGSGLLACRLETYGEGADLCRVEAGGTRLRAHEDLDAYLAGTRFRMDGPGVLLAAGRRLPKTVARVLSTARVSMDEIALVVPHQASRHGLDLLPRLLRIGPERVIDIYAGNGNQIAASLPTALHRAITEGRLAPGDLCLLLGTAAGLSIGAAVLRY